jgi:FAD/FMN-containing dehydrogenase
VDDATPLTESWKRLGDSDWLELVRLAHVDRGQAFRTYSAYYLSTNGQIYPSDSHQFSTYVDDYHTVLGERLGRAAIGGEMITELYVPRAEMAGLLETMREDFRRHRPSLIYGTIRVIEREDETFLNWARESWACVIVNLHVGRATGEVAKAADDFRRLIDRALERGGSYYLTYHHWATREQVLAAYPQFPEFLARKKAMDPDRVFTSDWYEYQRGLVEGHA